jgi:hypothetical protein
MRRLPHQDAVDGGCGLEPRRGVDDVTGRHPLPLVGACSQRNQCLAGIDGDAQLEVGLLFEHPVANRQRRPNGPLGVVLMRHGGPEECHDRVTDELLDRPSEVLQLRAQPRVVRREQARTSSGSRRSEREVNPTRSAKRTVTTLRSSRGTAVTGNIAPPHSEQNFAPSWFLWPQAGQRVISRSVRRSPAHGRACLGRVRKSLLTYRARTTSDRQREMW